MHTVSRSEIARRVAEDARRSKLERKLSIERGCKALLRLEKESGREGVLVAIRDWLNAPHYGPVS